MQAQSASLATVKTNSQIEYLYDGLKRLGYPEMFKNKIVNTLDEKKQIMFEYFQPTSKRFYLIEWFISNINPQYINDKEITMQKNKALKLIAALWKLGALPISKHTKHLDYERYVEGQLGYQNAVNLLYNLCTLALECKSFSKTIKKDQFGSFLSDLFQNYESLINTHYDQYGVTFPPAYSDLSQIEFDKEFQQTMIQIKQIKQKKNESIQSQNLVKCNEIKSIDTIFQKFDHLKQRFLSKYEGLVKTVKETMQKHEKSLSIWKPNDSITERTLTVPLKLNKLYSEYKQLIDLNQYKKSNFHERKTALEATIVSFHDQDLY